MHKQLNEYVEYTIAQYIIKPRYKIDRESLLDICQDFKHFKKEDLFWHISSFMNLNIFTDLAIIKLKTNLPSIWYSRKSAIEHYKFNNLDDDQKHLYSYNENGIMIALKNKILNWRGVSMNSSRKAVSLLKKNPDKINYNQLNLNSSDWAVSLLKMNPDKFNINNAIYNSNPEIVNWFLENQQNINWGDFKINTNAKAIEVCSSKGYEIPKETIDFKFTNQLYKLFIKLFYDAKF